MTYATEEQHKLAIWEKASTVENYDPRVFRKDKAGAWIKWSDYGKTDFETNLGWQIDHSKPLSGQGSDDLDNMQPLHWVNNEAKGDIYPTWQPKVTSSGNKNITSERLPYITE